EALGPVRPAAAGRAPRARAARGAAPGAFAPVAGAALLGAATARHVVVHEIGHELAGVEVDLAERDGRPGPRPEHVIDVGANAELARQRVLQAEQGPGPAVVGRRRPPWRVELDEQIAAEPQEGLRRDLEVAADEPLGPPAFAMAPPDARGRVDVAADAGQRVQPHAGP